MLLMITCFFVQGKAQRTEDDRDSADGGNDVEQIHAAPPGFVHSVLRPCQRCPNQRVIKSKAGKAILKSFFIYVYARAKSATHHRQDVFSDASDCGQENVLASTIDGEARGATVLSC